MIYVVHFVESLKETQKILMVQFMASKRLLVKPFIFLPAHNIEFIYFDLGVQDQACQYWNICAHLGD